VWTALGATAAAQLAVAPLLLVHFGSIPLFAPLTNVVASPLVAMSTALGGCGVLAGVGPITALGLVPASLVLGLARFAVDLPQLGSSAVAAAAAVAALAFIPRLRPLLALAGAVAVAATVVVPASPPGGPQLEVLDVGQGDAVLLRGPAGEVVLIDGGPDPGVLRRALRQRGIRRIDLLIVTHRHADHVSGLGGITAVVQISRAWIPADDDGALESVRQELHEAGVAVETPATGWQAAIGVFDLEVLGPRRRYGGINDQSIVVMARAAGRSVALTGDIEVTAQEELGPLHADVMKIPHQGAATSDLGWLAASAPRVAVISVGPNDFGHPAAEVIDALEEAGAVVYRTDRDGTVTIRLDEL
jgi:competence protein ComEC